MLELFLASFQPRNYYIEEQKNMIDLTFLFRLYCDHGLDGFNSFDELPLLQFKSGGNHAFRVGRQWEYQEVAAYANKMPSEELS